MTDEEVPLCENCDSPLIKECGGRGMIFRGPPSDLNTDQCPNLWRRQMRAHLGPEIAAVEHFRNSPLYYKDPTTGRITDRTKRNTAITSVGWRGFLPHLKWALCAKGPAFFFKVVTDKRILDVYLGHEGFQNRPKSIRHDIETFNGVRDLVGDNYNLVVIRLGFLSYTNVAAAGVLKEALMIREDLHLPTWIVREPNRGWKFSADDDVKEYIKANFKGVKNIVGPDEFDVDEIVGQVEEGSEELDDVEVEEEDDGEESADLDFEEAPTYERGGGGDSGGGMGSLMDDPTVMGSKKKKWRDR